jgi:uncharacterized protein YeaO (DUF488 family)
MALHLRIVQLGSPRTRDEGLRIGTVRYLPRGVRKADLASLDYFDVWLPILAPSRELLRQAKAQNLATDRFFARYRREMQQTDARQTIQLLAELARRTAIAVGCYCEDEAQCHRSVLIELIRNAARSKAGDQP